MSRLLIQYFFHFQYIVWGTCDSVHQNGRRCALACHVVLMVCNWFFSLLVLPPSSFLPFLPPSLTSSLPLFLLSLPSLLFLLSFTPPSCSPSHSSILSSSPPTLPPPSLSRSPSTDRSDLETSFSHNHAYLRDVASLDINSSEFGSLPAEVQHELLLERQQMEKYSYNDPATLPQVHKSIVALR